MSNFVAEIARLNALWLSSLRPALSRFHLCFVVVVFHEFITLFDAQFRVLEADQGVSGYHIASPTMLFRIFLSPRQLSCLEFPADFVAMNLLSFG